MDGLFQICASHIFNSIFVIYKEHFIYNFNITIISEELNISYLVYLKYVYILCNIYLQLQYVIL